MKTEICEVVSLTERQEYAERIRKTMGSTVEAIIETGRLLCEAKAKLKHGDWTLMVENDLPFSPQTVRQLMAVSLDRRFQNNGTAILLPPHWTTLYKLSELHDDEFERGIEEGIIRPDMKRSDVKRLHAVPGHLAKPAQPDETEKPGDVEHRAVHVMRLLSEDLDTPRRALLDTLHGMMEQCDRLNHGEAKGLASKFAKQIDKAIEYLNMASIGQLVIDADRFVRAAWEKINP